ncbi:MAG: conjugal transfer protein TraC, partial [Patescibacteria group bacterium]
MEIPFLTKKQAPSQIPTMPTPEEIYAAGITTLKDVMAPASLEVSATFVRIGNQFSRTIFVYSYPRYLGANWFSPVINFDKIFDISIFIHPIETSVALKNFRKQVARVQAQLSEHEEKGM